MASDLNPSTSCMSKNTQECETLGSNNFVVYRNAPAQPWFKLLDVTALRGAEAARARLFGDIFHDVRTPLTSLTMAVRLLKRSIESIPEKSQRDLIETCLRETDRLRIRLDELMNVVTLNALGEELQVRKVALLNLVKSTVLSFQSEANETGVSLFFRKESLSEEVFIASDFQVDPLKITWALSIMLGNALQWAKQGGKVSVHSEFDSRGVLITMDIDSTSLANTDMIESWRESELDIAREIALAHGGLFEVTCLLGKKLKLNLSLPAEQLESFNTKDKGAVDGTNTCSR